MDMAVQMNSPVIVSIEARDRIMAEHEIVSAADAKLLIINDFREAVTHLPVLQNLMVVISDAQTLRAVECFENLCRSLRAVP